MRNGTASKCPPLCGKASGASLAVPRAFAVFGAAAFRSGLALCARTKGRSGTSTCAAVNQAGERWHATPEGSAPLRATFVYALRRARSARRMNDAAPRKRALRDGSQGSARKHSFVRATLRGCSIQGKPSTATSLHRGPHSCFLWLLSLQQQRK